jgi:hypothetical protein
LIAETGQPSKLTHLCATAIPASHKLGWTEAEEVLIALDTERRSSGVEDIYGERMRHFMELPDIELKSDISKAVQYVSRHLELYSDIFQSSVS